MEYIQVKNKWQKPAKFAATVVGLFLLAVLIINVFPPARDVVWFLLGMIATRLDVNQREEKRPQVQHVRRGTTYNVLGKARIQTEWPVVDNVELTVYQGTEDGKLWARPTDEFEDGRFVQVDK